MAYKQTDILCVFAGLGATTAVKMFPNYYYEARNVNDAIAIASERKARYVLLDADKETIKALQTANVDFAIIVPDGDECDWTARWIKAGSSVSTIKARLARWIDRWVTEFSGIPVVYIPTDKWLSQMLSQTTTDITDEKDV